MELKEMGYEGVFADTLVNWLRQCVQWSSLVTEVNSS
jgi:hypothetical protein